MYFPVFAVTDCAMPSYLSPQCNVDGDYSSLNIIAEALLKIQMQFGIIPNIRSKGHASRKVLQKMLSMRVEEAEHAQAAMQQQQNTLSGSGGGGGGMGASFVPGTAANHGTYGGPSGAVPNARRSVAEKYSSRSEIDLLVV